MHEESRHFLARNHRYENPDYGKYSISTLLELADAFDVALVVHFASYSELVKWDLDQSSNKLQPAPFDDDQGLWGEGQTSTTAMIFPADKGPVRQDIDDRELRTTDLEISGTQQEYVSLEGAVA